MAVHDLEIPGTESNPAWDDLWAARGDEIVAARPIFTGDVFERVPVQRSGRSRARTVMVVHHPCALRNDGIELNPVLLVVEVDRFDADDVSTWAGNYDKMPLPEVDPKNPGKKRHRAAFFDRPYLVSPDELAAGTRIASMSQVGVNLLMQRWTHYSTRLVVPSRDFQDVTGGPFEEAELIEEWCTTVGADDQEQTKKALEWLREEVAEGLTRQACLEEPQRRSAIRKQMRSLLSGE